MHRVTRLSSLFLLAAAACACSPPLHAQTPAFGTGCTQQREAVYNCQADAFRLKLSRSRVVRIDTDRLDRFASKQLRTLVESMGKRIAEPERRPDLIFDLAPVDRSDRIDFGPADVPLGTLKVYDPAKGTGPRSLVWVETFSGQEDRPWPTVAIELVRQFQKDFQAGHP